MSEEKLYAVKNDEGIYWDFLDSSGFWALYSSDCPTTTSKDQAEQVANDRGGHVVTFVEEPKKVMLSKEQAKIVEDAHLYVWPAKYITENAGSGYELERLLVEAYVNGYTVENEKKYNVKVPHTDDSYFYKIDHEICNAADSFHIDLDRPEAKFTKLEINHYHLQDCKKEEVTDDGTK
jgi:hypothetical protein|nr:MAG TPA: Protein of unknown function (DUF1642) [Bacteriophage sp.]